MEAEIKVYKYDTQLQTKKKDLEKATHLTQKEKQKIRDYINFLHATNLSEGRIVKNLYFILRLNKDFGMRFDRIDKKNIQDVIGRINQSHYKEGSRHDIKAFVKKYIKYFLGKKYDASEWDWLKIRVSKEKVKLTAEGDILEVAEIERMLAVCDRTRDKALISSLYESACRPSEILTLKIKDVKFDKYGAILNLRKSKTVIRPVRVVNSAPYLNAWINVHPYKRNIDSPLWIANRSAEALGLNTVHDVMDILAKRAGIKKRVYPYLLRHSRITHMLRNPKLPHSVVKRIVGWTDDSNMISTYLHMSNDTVDEAVLEANGIKKSEDVKDIELTKPLTCPRCDQANGYDAKVCQRCYFALDAAFQAEIDERATELALLMNNPETIKVMQMSKKQLQEWKRQKQIELLTKKGE